LNPKNAQILKFSFSKLGRMPDYSEYSHFSDIPLEIENFIETFENRVYIDITQMLKQKHITGIQKVVDSFYNPLRSDLQFIFFRNGNFYKTNFSKDKIVPKVSLYVNLMNQIRFILLSIGYRIWTRYLSRLIQNMKSYTRLMLIAKGIRDYFLPKLDQTQMLTPESLIGSILFIPDLPAERKHLETLLVLAENNISKLKIIVHDLIPITNPELMPNGSTQEFNLYGKILSCATTLYCLSKKVEIDLEKWLKFINQSKVYPVIKLYPPLVNSSGEKFDVSHKLIRSLEMKNQHFVVAVGTILNRKNYAVVIRALNLLELEKFACSFLVIANLNWDDHAVKLSQRLLKTNKFMVLPSIDDDLRNEIISCSTAVVYPSLAEGFGIPIYEALSLNKKVLVNNISPMNEWAHSFSNIVVVNKNSAASWAKSIKDVIMAQKTEVAVNNFNFSSWKSWAENILEDVVKI